MTIKFASNLSRNRYGVLHFRIAIPPDLRNHFKVKEIYRSLHTASIKDAAEQAQTLSIALKRAFAAIRQQSMSSENKPPKAPSDDSPLPQEALSLLKGAPPLFRIIELAQKTLRLRSQIDEADQATADAVDAHRLDKARDAETLKMLVRASTKEAAPSTPLFSKLINDYMSERKSKGKWTAKTEKENAPIYNRALEIIGDIPIGEITRPHAQAYVETLKKLPANSNGKKYEGKTVHEIAAMGEKPIAGRTFNKNVERISSLFKWAISEPEYRIQYNPFSNRSLDDSKGAKREPFTNDELVALFGAAEHAGRSFKTAYSYWLPLMGLLTGARLGELCQLYLVDFEIVSGIHCINIQDEEAGQRVKNKSARRHVPIHEKLIEAGLLRYVEQLRAQGHTRLFPMVKPHPDNGYGHQPSKWFGLFKKRCGITEKHVKVFHSFRHTFISALLDDEVPESTIAPIVGHEGELITGRVYWNKKDPIKRKLTIEKFQPPPEVWALVPTFEEITVSEHLPHPT